MASAGTLLSDLDGTPGGDGDLVQKILSDMNIPTTASRPIPPPMPQQMPSPMSHQMASSTMPMTMDSRIPTSHIIGNEHPTPADFAAAMAGMGGPQTMGAPIGMMPGSVQQQYIDPSPGYAKNFYGRVLDEAKVPFVVALLFFVFSLPPIRILIAHYLPSLIKHTGEFQLTGLVAVATFVGATFWLLQRVISPLLSL